MAKQASDVHAFVRAREEKSVVPPTCRRAEDDDGDLAPHRVLLAVGLTVAYHIGSVNAGAFRALQATNSTAVDDDGDGESWRDPVTWRSWACSCCGCRTGWSGPSAADSARWKRRS